MYLLIIGIIVTAMCIIWQTYSNDKVDYRQPRETWPYQEQEIYQRKLFLKHLSTSGIVLMAMGFIGMLLGW